MQMYPITRPIFTKNAYYYNADSDTLAILSHIDKGPISSTYIFTRVAGTSSVPESKLSFSYSDTLDSWYIVPFFEITKLRSEQPELFI